MRIRLRYRADNRGNVDQHALALVTQMGQHRPGAMDVTHDVDLKNAPEVAKRNLLERCKGGDRGAINPDINPPKTLRYPVSNPPHRLLIGDISGHKENRRSKALAFSGDLLQRCSTARGQRNGGASGRKLQRSRAAYTAGRPGDDDNRTSSPHNNTSTQDCWLGP